MPILAGLPVIETPEDLNRPWTDTRTLGFESLDGQNVLPFTGLEYILQEGAEGIDLAPRELILKKRAGMDGAVLDEIRINEREVFLPLFVADDLSLSGWLAKTAGLRSLFNHRQIDYRDTEGTFNLVASYDGKERRLRCTYSDGMPGAYGKRSGHTWYSSYGLKLMCVRPNWFGERWSTPIIRRPQGAKFFGRFPPRIASSRVLGSNIPVLVGGDVESWPDIDLVGPSSAVNVDWTGCSVSIPDGLGDGEPATIKTSPRGRGRTVLFDGVKDWGRVAPSTRWAPLQPGAQTVSIVMATAGAASSAQVSGDSEFETPW